MKKNEYVSPEVEISETQLQYSILETSDPTGGGSKGDFEGWD